MAPGCRSALVFGADRIPRPLLCILERGFFAGCGLKSVVVPGSWRIETITGESFAREDRASMGDAVRLARYATGIS